MKDEMVRELTQWAIRACPRGGPTRDRREETGRQLDLELERLREMQRRAADCMATAGPGKLDQAGMLVARYILTGDAREVES